MNVGSLFSGIGGIELGFEREGFKTEWFVENTPYCKAILAKRFPNAKIYDDITQLDFASLPKVDVLTGGFPCQDISNAGKRAGIQGSRSGLWKYFAKSIRILRPKIVFVENVSALLNRGLDTVLADLAKIGYDAEWHCVPASAVGAPHRRDRIFIIATIMADSCEFGLDAKQSKPEKLFNKRQQSTEENLSRGCGLKSSTNHQHNAHVADSDQFGRDNRQHHWQKRPVQDISRRCFQKDKPKGDRWQHGSGKIGQILPNTKKNMADSAKQRFERRKRRTPKRSRPTQQGWWESEPELGRVAYGIPNRVDRIKSIGNAVVPQLAQAIAKTIKQKEETK